MSKIIKTKSVKKKAVILRPTKKTSQIKGLVPVKPTKNTTAYYECLCESSKQGLQGRKITQITHACKVNSQAIISKRTQTIKTLSQAYKQLGTALDSLIK